MAALERADGVSGRLFTADRTAAKRPNIGRLAGLERIPKAAVGSDGVDEHKG